MVNLGILPEKYRKLVFGLKKEGCSRTLVNCPDTCLRKSSLYNVFSCSGTLKEIHPVVYLEKIYLRSKKRMEN